MLSRATAVYTMRTTITVFVRNAESEGLRRWEACEGKELSGCDLTLAQIVGDFLCLRESRLGLRCSTSTAECIRKQKEIHIARIDFRRTSEPCDRHLGPSFM